MKSMPDSRRFLATQESEILNAEHLGELHGTCGTAGDDQRGLVEAATENLEEAAAVGDGTTIEGAVDETPPVYRYRLTLAENTVLDYFKADHDARFYSRNAIR